jgi:hypothetical protein
VKSTNYYNTFIVVSGDCPARKGMEPEKEGSVANLQYRLLRERPYSLTSDKLLFEVYALRNHIAEPDREQARSAFFSKPQACLRTSPLVKQFGWGLHHDDSGRLAAFGVETEDYRKLAARADLKVVPGLRGRKS